MKFWQRAHLGQASIIANNLALNPREKRDLIEGFYVMLNYVDDDAAAAADFAQYKVVKDILNSLGFKVIPGFLFQPGRKQGITQKTPEAYALWFDPAEYDKRRRRYIEPMSHLGPEVCIDMEPYLTTGISSPLGSMTFMNLLADMLEPWRGKKIYLHPFMLVQSYATAFALILPENKLVCQDEGHFPLTTLTEPKLTEYRNIMQDSYVNGLKLGFGYEPFFYGEILRNRKAALRASLNGYAFPERAVLFTGSVDGPVSEIYKPEWFAAP